MEEYQFARALSYDFGALANMFTEAFTGYFFPMNMTPEALANHWRLYQIDGARSLVMRDPEGTFVAMTLIGARGTRGWCGGFGVAPAFRGHGAGKRLAREMVETGDALPLEVSDVAIEERQHLGLVAGQRACGLGTDERAHAVHVGLAERGEEVVEAADGPGVATKVSVGIEDEASVDLGPGERGRAGQGDARGRRRHVCEHAPRRLHAGRRGRSARAIGRRVRARRSRPGQDRQPGQPGHHRHQAPRPHHSPASFSRFACSR